MFVIFCLTNGLFVQEAYAFDNDDRMQKIFAQGAVLNAGIDYSREFKFEQAFEKMLEAKWEIDSEQGRGWKYSGNIPDLFSENKTNELEDKLKVYLKESRKYNGDVYEFTLRQGYLPTHTKQIFEEWQKDNILDVTLSNGEKARKKSFYIKYFKATDQEIKKVYFNLK